MRTGRGAEILVLMDRSRSMDDNMLTSDWRQLDPLAVRAHPGPRRAEGQSRARSAGEIRRASARMTALR